MTQPRILIAEDNAVNQLMARRMLEKLGCSVDVAKDGNEAVAMARSARYDLIFMDCSMPGLDGFQATQELRRQDTQARRIPIIALTAGSTDADCEKCLGAGMDAYLTKPVDLGRFRSALDQWLVPETS